MEQLPGYLVSYLIVAAVMTPIAGKMSDLYGKKKVLLVLLTLYVVGITAGVFSNNISFLLASRIIQGVGLAAVPAAFSLLRDTFPPEKLAIAVGVFGSAYSAGSVVGLLAGATIIQKFGWHSTFLSIIPFAVVVTIIVARFVKENKRQLITDSIIRNQEQMIRRGTKTTSASFIPFFRHKRRFGTFYNNNFISNCVDSFTERYKLQYFTRGWNCIPSFSHFIGCLCLH